MALRPNLSSRSRLPADGGPARRTACGRCCGSAVDQLRRTSGGGAAGSACAAGTHLPDRAKPSGDVHFPDTLESARAARRRFVYEEFLILQLALALRRRDVRDRQRAPVLAVTPQIDAHIRRLFPFPPHRRSGQGRRRDQPRPGQRSARCSGLLQADVGAGKTAVAVYALLVAVANKHQAILMAPTEVLARQHWQTLERYLANSRVRRRLLTGGLIGAASGRRCWRRSAAGEVDLVVGTQALVQEGVEFARLGLVVIDEQHKFGVNQRARVAKLGVDPHYLVMTATPIPRTIALTVFGDLDVSDHQPAAARPATRGHALAPRIAARTLYQRLRDEMKQGRQAFRRLPARAGIGSPRPDRRRPNITRFCGTAPSRLPRRPAARPHGATTRRPGHGASSATGKLDLLVTTAVIEVGVDVPNATLMVIEHADRFGLSQLHQLRGRVSRGDVAGQC